MGFQAAAVERKATFRTVPTVVPLRKLPRAALAGGLAGALVNGVLHPIDTVKSVRQADSWRRSQSTWAVFWQLLRDSGPSALYRGILPAILGAATSSAVYFGTYESVRALILWYQERHLPLGREIGSSTAKSGRDTSADALLVTRSFGQRGLIHMIAAACGNVVSSFIFVPKEVIKQRLQTGRESTVQEVFAHQHLRGLYWGYRATLLRNVPNAMLNFVLYEEFKLRLGQLREAARQNAPGTEQPRQSRDRASFPAVDLLVAGSLAGALSSALTTPFDVLKTRFGTATSARIASRSLVALATHIIRQEGVGGLFRGVGTRALWAALFSAIGFTTYEWCKSLLVSRLDSRACRLPVPARHHRRDEVRRGHAWTSSRPVGSRVGRVSLVSARYRYGSVV
jgi:solute carrier family 25 S-adenosylmethionine transporter 26